MSVQSDDSVPARDVTLIGASPAESPGETWGIGEVGEDNSGVFAIVRYAATVRLGTRSPSRAAPPVNRWLGFQPDPTPLMGAMTAAGDGVLVGTRWAANGCCSCAIPAVPSPRCRSPRKGRGRCCGPSEEIYLEGRTPLIAPLDEGGHAGALLVPIDKDPEGNETGSCTGTAKPGAKSRSKCPRMKAKRRPASGCSRSPQLALERLAAGAAVGRLANVALFHRDEGRWKEVDAGAADRRGAAVHRARGR